jgi:methionyl aminopeptidase
MRAAGLIVWQAHQSAARILKPGVSTAQLNEVYQQTFESYGAQPLFLNYGGIPDVRPPFPAATCISINEEVVHGIPGPRTIKDGDIVSLDTGCRIAGWCGDAAVTHAVGKIDSNTRRLLKATNEVLHLAIKLMGETNRWSSVCRAMEDFIHETGFSVVEDMVGHGIGKDLHEPPQVPNYFSEPWAAQEDFDLRPGVVLAVEPMVNMGVHELVELDDGWTIVTADRKPSAHFEHTIAITKDGPVRLTGPPNDEELSTMPAWLHDSATWVDW